MATTSNVRCGWRWHRSLLNKGLQCITVTSLCRCAKDKACRLSGLGNRHFRLRTAVPFGLGSGIPASSQPFTHGKQRGSNFKRFRKLADRWVALALLLSQLTPRQGLHSESA